MNIKENSYKKRLMLIIIEHFTYKSKKKSSLKINSKYKKISKKVNKKCMKNLKKLNKVFFLLR